MNHALWRPLLAALATTLALSPGPTSALAEQPQLYPDAMARQVPKPTWLRRRLKPKTRKPTGQGLIDISQWPAEPASPPRDAIDPARFAGAIKQVCGWDAHQAPGAVDRVDP